MSHRFASIAVVYDYFTTAFGFDQTGPPSPLAMDNTYHRVNIKDLITRVTAPHMLVCSTLTSQKHAPDVLFERW
jgi:hypothetical protein